MLVVLWTVNWSSVFVVLCCGLTQCLLCGGLTQCLLCGGLTQCLLCCEMLLGPVCLLCCVVD